MFNQQRNDSSEMAVFLRFGAAVSAIFVAAALSGCFGKLETISSRTPASFDKLESGPMDQNARGDGGPPELFVRTKDVRIVPSDVRGDSGSLFNLDDERNYLYGQRAPGVGAWIDIQVASTRVDAGSGGADPESSAGAGTPAASGGTAGAASASDDELLKALPNLEPAGKDAKPIKNFKMKIVHQDQSGDVIAQFQRRSMRDEDAAEISVTARVPLSRLSSGEPLTTNDLSDVKWIENRDGQIAERRSANWEDEYTMRLSGFDEARSKEAIALEDKRKQLVGVREKLDTRIRSLAQERTQMTKQREDLMAKQKTDQEKIAELQKTVDEQKRQIEQNQAKDKAAAAKSAETTEETTGG